MANKGVLHFGGAIAPAELDGAPSNPVRGTLYFNTTDNKFYLFTKNSVWREIIDQDILSAILGTLNATPTNYTPTEATHAGHLGGIDTALVSAGVDEQVKVSSNDTTPSYLSDKLVAASEANASEILELKQVNDGADEDLKIAFDESKLAHVQAGGTKHAATQVSYASASKTDVQAGSIELEAAVQDLDDNKLSSTLKGANNGLAELDAGGKIPASQLTSTLMEYLGSWDASTNLPVLADGTGTNGDTYKCSVGGTLNLGSGNIDFVAGDWVVYNGTIWEKSINSDAIQTVNGQTGIVVLNTSHITESGNVYHTDVRAQTAAVVDSVAGGETVKAPSVASVSTALAGKISALSDDPTPQLAGNLDVNGNRIDGDDSAVHLSSDVGIRRSDSATPTNFIQQAYLHAISLSASQTDQPIAALTFAHADFVGFTVDYMLIEANSGDVRIGKLMVVTNGTTVVITDQSGETAPTGISFDVQINGANVEFLYSSGANAVTMRGDVKLFSA